MNKCIGGVTVIILHTSKNTMDNFNTRMEVVTMIADN